MTNTAFLTINVTDKYLTKFNGRLNRDQVYMYSLGGVAQCGNPIYCISGQYNVDFVEPYLQSKNISNVKHVKFELENFELHDRIMQIKDEKTFYCQDNSWLNRNSHIMALKFYGLEQLILGRINELDPNVSVEERKYEYYYWIDAGISSGNLIPRKFNTFHPDKRFWREDGSDLKLEEAHYHNHIFNSQFSQRLNDFTKDKVLLMVSNHGQHNDTFGFDIPRMDNFPVGAIFGGRADQVLQFIQEFKRIHKQVLDHNCLVKEEQIMAVILHEHPEWFIYDTPFQTFYHGDWSCYNYELRSFSDFFDKCLGCPTNI